MLVGNREEGELPLDKTQEIESLLLTKKDMINKQLGDLNLLKIFGITDKRGWNVTEMPIYKAFIVPGEANRKKRETQRKAVLWSRTVFKSLPEAGCIFNAPCIDCAVLLRFAYQGLTRWVITLQTKNEYGKKYIQGAVLRERQQGKKRYCPHELWFPLFQNCDFINTS